MARISPSNSSGLSFNFFTKLSMARLEKLSDSPPCRWHMRLCTIEMHASADDAGEVTDAPEIEPVIVDRSRLGRWWNEFYNGVLNSLYNSEIDRFKSVRDTGFILCKKIIFQCKKTGKSHSDFLFTFMKHQLLEQSLILPRKTWKWKNPCSALRIE